MPITVDCDCGRTLRVKDEMAGRKGRCPECRGVFDIPRPGRRASRTAEVQTDPPPRRKRRVSPEPEEPPRRKRRVSAEPEEPPRRRRRPELEEESPRRRKQPAKSAKLIRIEEPEAPAKSARLIPVDEPEENQRPRRRKRRRRIRDDDEGSSFNTSRLGAILGGLAMMGGAAAWFVVGLKNDIIYFYPPVLFILGLGSFGKGILGMDVD